MNAVLIVDSARCAHDKVDDETMVIDTLTGHLLLFDGLASTLWDRLRTGATLDALVTEVAARYGDDAADAARAFVGDLVAADLVVPSPDAAAAPADSPTSWPDSYTPPTIERFDEIADIMSMDPIHQVDTSSGWPHPADGAG